MLSNEVELALLTGYPLPSKVIVDQGNKVLVEFKPIIQANYSIMVKLVTSRNPQPDSTEKIVHEAIGNIIRAFKVQDMVLDDAKTVRISS